MLGGEGLVRGVPLPREQKGGQWECLVIDRAKCWEERGGSEVFHALGLGVFNHLEGGGYTPL